MFIQEALSERLQDAPRTQALSQQLAHWIFSRCVQWAERQGWVSSRQGPFMAGVRRAQQLAAGLSRATVTPPPASCSGGPGGLAPTSWRRPLGLEHAGQREAMPWPPAEVRVHQMPAPMLHLLDQGRSK